MQLTKEWISGFVDGKGCFNIEKIKTKHGTVVLRHRFLVSQDEKSISVLYGLKQTFKCGTVHKAGDDMMAFQVSQVTHLQTIIIPFFQKYTLNTCKRESFNFFVESLENYMKQKQIHQIPSKHTEKKENDLGFAVEEEKKHVCLTSLLYDTAFTSSKVIRGVKPKVIRDVFTSPLTSPPNTTSGGVKIRDLTLYEKYHIAFDGQQIMTPPRVVLEDLRRCDKCNTTQPPEGVTTRICPCQCDPKVVLKVIYDKVMNVDHKHSETLFPPFTYNFSDGWFRGFVDAEGCFFVKFVKDYPRVQLLIGLQSKERPFLIELQKFLKCGTLITKKDNSEVLQVVSSKDLERYVFPKLQTKGSAVLLQTSKRLSYQKFRKIVRLIIEKKHHTIEGLQKMKSLKCGLNKSNQKHRSLSIPL